MTSTCGRTDRPLVTIRALARVEKQQERLIAKFRKADDDSLPWELVEREISRAEKEKQQLRATISEIERRLAEQQQAIGQLDALKTYCERVAQNLERFGFEEKRMALEALGVRIKANGRDWQLTCSIPTGVGVTYQIQRTVVAVVRAVAVGRRSKATAEAA